jgi:methyl-accepting chemotaxis protein WspA
MRSLTANMSLGRRLNTALLLMVILLLAGVGLVLWMQEARLVSKERIDALSDTRERLLYRAVLASEAVRVLAKDPTNDAAKANKRDVDKEFSALDQTEASLPDNVELQREFGKLRDFITNKLQPFHSQVLKSAEAESTAAVADFDREFPGLRNEREQVFHDFALRIVQFKAAEAKRARNINIIGLSGVGVICTASIFLLLFQLTAMTKPLNRLVETLERMRRGDFTERLDLKRSDEFGVLGNGLNRLADDLSDLVGHVQRSGIQVNTTATEISATARQQQSTAHEIAATTAQIGATSKQISTTSKELVKTMNEVSQVAEQTARLAGSGQNAISRMEATMRQIMEASGSITAKLAVLSEKTTNINSVVTTITKVADQTNLLSLNAAIEAEKAGEYGLGFAVVAMEIRRLADQTAVATYDIEKMVKEMQTAVSSGVMGMDKFSEEAKRGVEEIQQVSTHLGQIINQVQTLTPRFQTVNEGMHAQAHGAQQISETLTQLTEAAQQTAESLRQSNMAIEQLNGAARSLQTSVARFKLNS